MCAHSHRALALALRVPCYRKGTVQLSLPWASPAPPASAPRRPVAPPIDPVPPIVFVRHRRARRYILRVLPDGTLRVTMPRWGVKREALAFVAASRAWIGRQRAKRAARPRPSAWRVGTSVLLDGERLQLHTSADADGAGIWLGAHRVGDASPGADADLRPDVERWLRARAVALLPDELLRLARAHEVTVARVSVRNQRSRWGACTSRGTITLNWRLVQTPAFVREYVLIHELMHRRELNHSRRFWRLVVAVCPRHADARHWLKTEGHSLWSDIA